MSKYSKFILMIVFSTIVMFALTYLNTYELDHVYFSQTRGYMALIMGSSMLVIMLAFMRQMVPNPKANFALLGAATLIFFTALWQVRNQRTVDDVAWMKAMIPHHSIAILTSERAQISDTRVRQLADRIIETQRKEIAEMKTLIEEIERSGKRE